MAAGLERTGNSPARAIAEAARLHDFDRYLSALLAPKEARADLATLAAYAGELTRIPDEVSEPALGRIRLEWWREALVGTGATGHPVADALNELAGRRGLPRPTLIDMIDARELLLGGAPFADETALFTFLVRTDGASFRLAAHVLDDKPGSQSGELCREAGKAYGLARLLFRLARVKDEARSPLPPAVSPAALRVSARQHAAEARGLAGRETPGSRAAVLPLALVEPYLRALEKAARDPPRGPAELSSFVRVWRLWHAARFGSF